MNPRTINVIVIALVGMVGVGRAGLGAQDSLSAAKDLYASAAYEDALSTLTRITEAGSTAQEIARQVDEYRAFCLYALGRTGEAESVAESMLRKDPLMKLDAADVSPRLESMFSNVRKRLLDYSREEFDRVVSLNLRSAFDLVRAFGPGMAERGRGSMIGFTSIRAVAVEPGQGVYAATKAGLLQLMRTAAADFAHASGSSSSMRPFGQPSWSFLITSVAHASVLTPWMWQDPKTV